MHVRGQPLVLFIILNDYAELDQLDGGYGDDECNLLHLDGLFLFLEMGG